MKRFEKPMTNWAGHHHYAAARIHSHATIEELTGIVAQARKVRALGTRHSFNDIADSPEDLISLAGFDRILNLDSNHERPSVTIESGITYGRLSCELHRAGFALPNLASLPHISVAGACATATHGSGDRNQILAGAVVAMQIVQADGQVVEISEETIGERFFGAVVGLGAIGIVTQLTLELLPTFQIRQDVFENLPLTVVTKQLDAIFSSAYSVSLFTDWRAPRFNQVWIKRRIGDGADLPFDPVAHGATAATSNLHPLAGMPAENCTRQLGEEGPWHERLPHFRMEFTPSAGEELQTEYFVPRYHAAAALMEVYSLRDQISPLLQISEIRSIAADEFWMSPCYRQACMGIHFTWKKDWDRVKQVLPLIERKLDRFEARPHWGKLFTMSKEKIQARYPKLGEFRKLMDEFDPERKLRNVFIERCLL